MICIALNQTKGKLHNIKFFRHVPFHFIVVVKFNLDKENMSKFYPTSHIFLGIPIYFPKNPNIFSKDIQNHGTY